MTKIGTLKVYHIQNGNVAHEVEVETPFQAMSLIDQWTSEDLNNPHIEFNAFGLEEYDDSDLPEADKGGEEGWSEWYNSDGQDIMEIMAEVGNMLE